MKRLGAALTLVVAACGSIASPTTTTDLRAFAAGEFAVSAGRALEGTRFVAMTSGVLADFVMELCAGTGSLLADVRAIVTSASAATAVGDPGDDAILAEVLAAGVGEVCPERAAADLSAAFLASVRAAVDAGAGAAVAGSDALNAGLSACLTLDQGTPEDALVTIVAGVVHVEVTAEDLLAGAISTEEGVTAGAVLAAAVSFLCPEHTTRVQEYLGEIARPPSG